MCEIVQTDLMRNNHFQSWCSSEEQPSLLAKPSLYLWLMKSNSWGTYRLSWPAGMINEAAAECNPFRSGTNCLLIPAVRQGNGRRSQVKKTWTAKASVTTSCWRLARSVLARARAGMTKQWVWFFWFWCVFKWSQNPLCLSLLLTCVRK